ncbi:hypothetical protein DFJ63DRAFT_336902 [Scheffersomyces coipomensis]|uniref:uncharacterized protein n=1 Tax=Scheffersomyces coipomensis TaxID=1788519 RepID=UPI00315DB189
MPTNNSSSRLQQPFPEMNTNSNPEQSPTPSLLEISNKIQQINSDVTAIEKQLKAKKRKRLAIKILHFLVPSPMNILAFFMLGGSLAHNIYYLVLILKST